MNTDSITISDIQNSTNCHASFFSNTLLLAKSELPLRTSLQSYLNKKEHSEGNSSTWLSEYKYSNCRKICDLVKLKKAAIEIKLCYSFEFKKDHIFNRIDHIVTTDLNKIYTNHVFNKNEEKYFILFIIHFNPESIIGCSSCSFKDLKYVTGRNYLTRYNNIKKSGNTYQEEEPKSVSATFRGCNLFENDNTKLLSDINLTIMALSGYNSIRSKGFFDTQLQFYTEQKILNYNLFCFLYQL